MDHSLKDVTRAYIKASGLIIPTRYVWRPFREVLEVDRCCVDGEIVTNSQASLSRHGGHQIQNPTKISVIELILIWLGFIE